MPLCGPMVLATVAVQFGARHSFVMEVFMHTHDANLVLGDVWDGGVVQRW